MRHQLDFILHHILCLSNIGRYLHYQQLSLSHIHESYKRFLHSQLLNNKRGEYFHRFS